MLTNIYFADGFIKSWYDGDRNVIVVKWFNATTRIHHRESFKVHHAALIKYKPKAFIIDTSESTGIPYPEEQEWAMNTVFPELKKLNIPIVVTIFPQNPIARSGMKLWQDMSQRLGFNYIAIDTLDETYSFLQNH